MKPAIRILALVTVAFLCGQPVLGQTVGAITGTVSSDDGVLPAGLAVVLHKIPEYTNASKTGMSQPRVIASSIRTPQVLGVSSTGAFGASAVPSGHYKLCASPPDGYLDTCLWTGPVDVVLAPGSSSTAGNLRLRRGAVVHIRLDDPQSLLPSVETSSVEWGVVAGVMTPAGETHLPRRHGEGSRSDGPVRHTIEIVDQPPPGVGPGAERRRVASGRLLHHVPGVPAVGNDQISVPGEPMRLRRHLLVAAMLPLGSVWAQRPTITSIDNAASYTSPHRTTPRPAWVWRRALLSLYSEITYHRRR